MIARAACLMVLIGALVRLMPAAAAQTELTPTPVATPTETETPTAVPTETATALPPTATAVPPTMTPLPSPMPTATAIPGDSFEDDTPPHAPVYIGPQLRSFHPAGDVDYVRYRLKAAVVTYFETHDLTGEADTFVCVYRDDDGFLTGADHLLGCDDDSGQGLASLLTLQVSADMDVTVTIQNQAIGYAPPVGYSFRIIAGPNATPTATARPPTAAPRPDETATPYPTYTPYPTPTALPPSPTTPPQPGAGAVARPTATPAPRPVLYVAIFTDTNNDHFMDSGEGSDGVLVIFSTVDRQWQLETYTHDGLAALLSEDDFPAGEAEVLVQVPYLHRNGTFRLHDDRATTADIPLEAAEYPVYLP